MWEDYILPYPSCCWDRVYISAHPIRPSPFFGSWSDMVGYPIFLNLCRVGTLCIHGGLGKESVLIFLKTGNGHSIFYFFFKFARLGEDGFGSIEGICYRICGSLV